MRVGAAGPSLGKGRGPGGHGCASVKASGEQGCSRVEAASRTGCQLPGKHVRWPVSPGCWASAGAGTGGGDSLNSVLQEILAQAPHQWAWKGPRSVSGLGEPDWGASGQQETDGLERAGEEGPQHPGPGGPQMSLHLPWCLPPPGLPPPGLALLSRRSWRGPARTPLTPETCGPLGPCPFHASAESRAPGGGWGRTHASLAASSHRVSVRSGLLALCMCVSVHTCVCVCVCSPGRSSVNG